MSKSENIKIKYNKYKSHRLKINFKNIDNSNIKSNIKSNKKCKVAVIIPYRDREEHLKDFINCIAAYKNKEYIDLFVIEQDNLDKFNRGLLLNIGFYLADRENKYKYFIFHDVDSYPDNYLLDLYINCDIIDKVVHFASPHNKYKYQFNDFLGGVIGLSAEDFLKINGFPNNFFGWGGEDDAFYNRITNNNISVYRPKRGEYQLPIHNNSKHNSFKKKSNILFDLKEWRTNGVKQIINKELELEINKVDNYNTDKLSIFFYKINYFAIHYDWKRPNKFEKSAMESTVTAENKLIMHSTMPLYRSYIEPIITWDEVMRYIVETYTDPKRFDFKKKRGIIERLVSIQFKEYSKHLMKEDLMNTLYYIFHHFGEVIYYRIRDNKVVCRYHIYNYKYENDWSSYINFSKNRTVLNLLNNRKGESYLTIEHKKYWSNNGCNIFFEDWSRLKGNPTSYIREFNEMIDATIYKYKNVPDSDIIINRKDFQMLRRDGRYADYYMYPVDYDFNVKYNLNRVWPVASQSKTADNLDINIPSADEWRNLNKSEELCTDWNRKINKAVFRGSSTGCGTTIENNLRLKLANIALKHSDLLDVKIASKTGRVVKQFKINKSDRSISFINSYQYKELFGNFLTATEQSLYKYIFCIEGNAQAYRLPDEFRKKSLLLRVDSDYYMWFEPLLKDGNNIITIDREYNNLFDRLDYLQKDDKTAKKIAENGYKFGEKYINREKICEYLFNYMRYSNDLCSNYTN